MTPITALGSRYGIQGALGRSVKRASTSAWSPTDITGCLLWYDFSDTNTLFTDAGSTKVSADGDAIYQANDKSGNGYHATQSTSTYRPSYKTGIQNSLSSGLFDGTDDRLKFLISTSAPTTFTYFTVIKYASNPLNKSWFNIGTNNQPRTNSHLRMISATSHRFGLYYDDYDATLQNVTTNFTILTHTFDSSNVMKVYQNGTNKGLGRTAGGTFSSNGIGNLGCMEDNNVAAQFSNLYFAEAIVYNSALSDTDRGTVETYLNTKWAIYS